MSVDLKGNTNYVAFTDLNHELIAVRTNLSAVDMIVGNGLKVDGDMLYADLATDEDIELGTLGHLVDAAGIKPFLTDLQVVAGDGTIVTGSTVDTKRATVEETLTGVTVAADKTVSVEALKGALSSGKAVDVTSEPDQTITGDYKGTFTTTATTLGFAAFPKFAPNLVYLMLADVTVDTARNITPSGTWLDGTTTAKALAANTPTRIAMLFTSSAATCAATLTFSGSGTVTVTKLREFEVTGCSDEARKYIANLSNPDDFTKFYLVDYDEQNPWTYIIDMANSPAVTLMAGLSYKLDATTGTHTLTTDTCPVGYNGEDAHLTLFVGLNSNIVFQSPLNLIDPLTPGAGHNITVKFRDGQANAYVDDTDIGYVITVNSGTDSGSLYYALSTANEDYLVFANSTDNTPVNLDGVVAAKGAKTVVGNGFDKTTITGSGSFTSKTVFTNVSMDDVVVTGGTMTMGNVNIPQGGTVSLSDGSLAIEKVVGDGGTLDLGQKTVYVTNSSASIMGCEIRNGVGSSGGAIRDYATTGSAADVTVGSATITGCSASYAGGAMFVYGSASATINSCVLSGCAATFGGVLFGNAGAKITLNSCSIVGCSANEGAGVCVYNAGTKATLISCTISGCSSTSLSKTGAAMGANIASIEIKDCIIDGNIPSSKAVYLNNGSLDIAGSNVLTDQVYGSNGSVTIASGAILDLTGNTNATPIAPGGGIGITGGATIIGSAGNSGTMVFDVASAGMACTSIVNSGGIVRSGSNLYPPAGTYTGVIFDTRITPTSGSEITLNSCKIESVVLGDATMSLSGATELTATSTPVYNSNEKTGTVTIASGTTIKTARTGSQAVITFTSGTVSVDGACTIIDGNNDSHTVAGGTYAIIYANGATA